jgi:predicted sulfurtransferase
MYVIIRLLGVHLPATEYHKKLAEPNTVVIDVRNTYESDIGIIYNTTIYILTYSHK